MKSLNFEKLNPQKEDVLSKTQMKKILGGHDPVTDCTASTDCASGGSIS